MSCGLPLTHAPCAGAQLYTGTQGGLGGHVFGLPVPSLAVVNRLYISPGNIPTPSISAFSSAVETSQALPGRLWEDTMGPVPASTKHGSEDAKDAGLHIIRNRVAIYQFGSW